MIPLDELDKSNIVLVASVIVEKTSDVSVDAFCDGIVVLETAFVETNGIVATGFVVGVVVVVVVVAVVVVAVVVAVVVVVVVVVVVAVVVVVVVVVVGGGGTKNGSINH